MIFFSASAQSSVSALAKAWNVASQEMEAVRHIDFSFLSSHHSYSYAFSENGHILGHPTILSKDPGKAQYFNSNGIAGSVFVYLKKAKRTNNVDENTFVLTTVVVCYQGPKGKVVGEDTNLNGKMDPGEDSNHNGRIDSPVTIEGVVYEL